MSAATCSTTCLSASACAASAAHSSRSFCALCRSAAAAARSLATAADCSRTLLDSATNRSVSSSNFALSAWKSRCGSSDVHMTAQRLGNGTHTWPGAASYLVTAEALFLLPQQEQLLLDVLAPGLDAALVFERLCTRIANRSPASHTHTHTHTHTTTVRREGSGDRGVANAPLPAPPWLDALPWSPLPSLLAAPR